MRNLMQTDPEVFYAIEEELTRQRNKLELIASENIVSDSVLEAQGCMMTNKYAEGYPAKRYYGGCEYVDVAEDLAIDRAKKLFGAEFANVQPHSGSQANMAVYFTILEPGEKAEFSKAEQKITKSENNNENYMAFKTKKLVFSDTPLSEIVETLNSIYQSNIKLKNNNIAGCRITVSFDNQSLDAILNVLKATVDLNVNKTNSGIEISGNGCK